MIRNGVTKETQIIYCGDIYQLPPVSESEDSQCFEVSQRAVLTVPVRYDITIGETAHHYRYLIELYREWGDDSFDWDWLYDWAPNKKTIHSSINFTRKESEFLDRAIDYFKYNEYNTRILCYRNETINRYNTRLRDYFHHNEEHPYTPGEQIITNKPYYKTGFEIHNGELFIIEGVSIDKEYVKYRIGVGSGFETRRKELWCYYLRVYRPTEVIEVDGELQIDETKIGVLKIIHPASEDEARTIEYELLTQAKGNKKLWRDLYDFKDIWADISYTYAMSIHKSQGQTLSNVLVNANDILEVGKTNTKTKLQSLYVSVTRAQNNLTILLNKEKFT